MGVKRFEYLFMELSQNTANERRSAGSSPTTNRSVGSSQPYSAALLGG
jgi:hypothetical protein